MYKYLILILISVSCSSSSNLIKEVFLIPETYIGKVNIIYNIKEGAEEKYENNVRVYVIPQNGILLTKFKDIYGNLDQQFYLIDSNGNRKEIIAIKEESKLSDDSSKFVFRAGTVGAYGNSDDSTSLKYQEFIVSSKRNMDKYYTFEYINAFEQTVMELTKIKF